MASGSAGITRKTLMSSESASSITPPKYPAVSPMTTESAVASKPVAKPTIRVARVPSANCVKTSWPVSVVPSQCAHDGACSWSGLNAIGSWRITSGASSATATKKPTMPSPRRMRAGRSDGCSITRLQIPKNPRMRAVA